MYEERLHDLGELAERNDVPAIATKEMSRGATRTLWAIEMVLIAGIWHYECTPITLLSTHTLKVRTRDLRCTCTSDSRRSSRSSSELPNRGMEDVSAPKEGAQHRGILRTCSKRPARPSIHQIRRILGKKQYERSETPQFTSWVAPFISA